MLSAFQKSGPRSLRFAEGMRTLLLLLATLTPLFTEAFFFKVEVLTGVPSGKVSVGMASSSAISEMGAVGGSCSWCARLLVSA